MHKKLTIKQVAQIAGVSTQTISRVLNGRPDVSEETRNRILLIIADLNYSPSLLARRLRWVADPFEQSTDEIPSDQKERSLIGAALVKSAFPQEKAVWLLEGLEKGFITNGDLVIKL